MTRIFLLPLFFFTVFLLAGSQNSDGAVAITKHGSREGRVIVRQFERVVVTIVTEEKRLFQFYAQDVKMVTSEEKNLIGENTILREMPSNSADAVVSLNRGMEVIITENPTDRDWVKVKGWGVSEGWIPRSVLTDKVVFTPKEKGLLIEPSFDVQELVEPASEKVDSTTVKSSTDSQKTREETNNSNDDQSEETEREEPEKKNEL